MPIYVVDTGLHDVFLQKLLEVEKDALLDKLGFSTKVFGRKKLSPRKRLLDSQLPLPEIRTSVCISGIRGDIRSLLMEAEFEILCDEIFKHKELGSMSIGVYPRCIVYHSREFFRKNPRLCQDAFSLVDLGQLSRLVPNPVRPKDTLLDLFCLATTLHLHAGSHSEALLCSLYPKPLETITDLKALRWTHHENNKTVRPFLGRLPALVDRRHPLLLGYSLRTVSKGIIDCDNKDIMSWIQYMQVKHGELACVLFSDEHGPTLGMSLVHTMKFYTDTSLRHLWCDDIHADDLKSVYYIDAYGKNIRLILPQKNLDHLQRRITALAATTSHMSCEQPVPMTPFLLEAYASQTLGGIMTCTLALHQLVTSSSYVLEGDYPSQLLAPNDNNFIKHYGRVDDYLDAFGDEKHIVKVLLKPLNLPGYLLFKESKGRIVTSVKSSCRCLLRALKAYLELQAPHFIDEEGQRLMRLAFPDYVMHEGGYNVAETLRLYDMIDGIEDGKLASELFLSIYIDEPVVLPPLIPGLTKLHEIGPYLNSYYQMHNVGMKKRFPVTLGGLYYTLRALENMAHYPLNFASDVYRGQALKPHLQLHPNDYLEVRKDVPIKVKSPAHPFAPEPVLPEQVFPLARFKLHAAYDDVLLDAPPPLRSAISICIGRWQNQT